MKENKTIYASPSVKVVRMAAKCGIMSVSGDSMDMEEGKTYDWNWE